MPSDFWHLHQLRMDPWGADYEAPVALDAAQADTDACVAIDAEGVPWAAIFPPGDTPLPERLLMIDGRRRLDARLLGRDGEGIVYGAFATVAVGAVEIDRVASRAVCLAPVVKRVLAFGGNCVAPKTLIPCPLGSDRTLHYDHCLTHEKNEPLTPLAIVQAAMLQEEADLAASYTGKSGAMVLRDGPLRYVTTTPETILGYVKTMQKHYLPPPYSEILWNLPAGQRSAMFTIGGPAGTAMRWSWYLRSGAPEDAQGLHGLAGLVRLELSARVPLEEAKGIADATALLIPFYASRRYRDPRAPQNLTPIGALERELGRHMGDSALIERRLRHFLSLQGASS